MSHNIIDKIDAGQILNETRLAKGLTWRELAEQIDRPVVWTVAALLGKHPVPKVNAVRVGEILSLDDEVVSALQRQPYRIADAGLATDPTVYRFHEAIDVYGQALKELIHEEFGDGIMSAINFSVDFAKQEAPQGDRVVVTLNGKFLPYQW
ncbi:cyanase [Mycolicibacterium komossense]|uniref:Cyanate hydratase n=1 Tax=Mycolicibacterium komossense TaxID=1779 RepID=A0ABT3CJ06_9MYCO|nr:cyanase [Mycolicibacterium komossense]MCV7229430.1 cyanase [Mycolicibacterium komossense]